MSDDVELERMLARALAARRPVVAGDLEARLHAAVARPRRSWLWPVVMAAAVAAAAAFVIARSRGDAAPASGAVTAVVVDAGITPPSPSVPGAPAAPVAPELPSAPGLDGDADGPVLFRRPGTRDLRTPPPSRGSGSARPARHPPAAPARPGRLSVMSSPFATVIVDGRPWGPTPVLHRRLPAGRHTVSLVDPVTGAILVTKRIEIEADREHRWTVDLSHRLE